MSSLRRPPIEFLFCFSFICFSVCFRVCHSKTSFYWAGDQRSQEYRPRRRCEAGPAAPKPMAPGNGVTFSWRHAVDRRFGAAVDNTRGVVIPARPRLKRLSVIPDHLSQMRRNIVPPHKNSLKGGGWVFFSLWKVALGRACVACLGGSAVC